MDKNIRWKQRFQNFERSFKLLEKTIGMEKLSELERAGLIQFFELTFELSWKVIKDYLESEGYVVNTLKEALKQAYQINLLENGHEWMDILDDRNLTVHTYDEATSLKVEKLIREKYYGLLKKLYEDLKTKI